MFHDMFVGHRAPKMKYYLSVLDNFDLRTGISDHRASEYSCPRQTTQRTAPSKEERGE